LGVNAPKPLIHSIFLTVLRIKGEAGDMDFVEAFKYFKQSSNRNYAAAQLVLKICLHVSRAFPRDQNCARRYFSLTLGSDIVTHNEWNHIHRGENPIQVVSQ
jgi:TPR repeat protein